MSCTITHPTQNVSLQHKVMVGLCWLLIALQLADAGSTYLALETGHAQENNALLVNVAATLSWPVMWVIIIAKMVVSAFFWVAISRTKPTSMILGVLTALVAYCSYIIGMNFYWAWVLS